MNRKTIILALILVIIGFVVYLGFDVGREYFNSLVEYLKYYITGDRIYIAALVFIFAAALSAFFAFFSSVILVPFAIVVFGKFLTVVFLLVGWIIGASALYALAYYFGYPVFTYFVKEKKINKWMDKYSKDTGIIYAFLFRFFTPSETGLIFGLFRYNFFKYLLITSLAEMPFAIAVVYVGATALSFF